MKWYFFFFLVSPKTNLIHNESIIIKTIINHSFGCPISFHFETFYAITNQWENSTITELLNENWLCYWKTLSASLQNNKCMKVSPNYAKWEYLKTGCFCFPLGTFQTFQTTLCNNRGVQVHMNIQVHLLKDVTVLEINREQL